MSRAHARTGSAMPPKAGSPAAQGNNGRESFEVIDSGPIRRFDAEDVGRRDGRVKGGVDLEQPSDAKVPDRYVVLADHRIGNGGSTTMIRRGKLLTSINYDIKSLLRQGVRLHKLEVDEDPTACLVDVKTA